MIFFAAFIVLFFLLWGLFFAIGPAMQRGLAWSAHKTASYRYRDYLPVAVLLIVGALISAYAGEQFLDLAELVQSKSPVLQSADNTAHTWARDNRSIGSTLFFETMTRLGSPITLGVIVAVVAVPLALRRRWRWMMYLIFTACTGGLLNLALKSFFARARPDLALALRRAHGYSFPSGHAMGSIVVFGALAYLGFRIFTRWSSRSAAIAGSLAVTIAIATSRVYLGVHWISDIAAGLAAGLIWLTAVTIAYEALRRIRMLRSIKARAVAGNRPPPIAPAA